MIYVFSCGKCGRLFERIQGINDDHRADHCGSSARRVFTVPFTNKDLMYNFLDVTSFKKPVNIHSKRQYDSLLKKEGRVQVSRDDLKGIKLPDPKPRIKKFAKEMAKKIYDKGAMSWVMGKTKPNGRDKL